MGNTVEGSLVELGGDIDLRNASVIGDALCNAIHRSGSIVVDLSAVTFLDSTAIGMMVRVHDYANTWRKSVTWMNVQPEPLRVLVISGVDDHLNLTH